MRSDVIAPVSKQTDRIASLVVDKEIGSFEDKHTSKTYSHPPKSMMHIVDFPLFPQNL